MQIKRLTAPEYQLVTSLFNSYRIFYKQPSDITVAENYIKARLENNESVIFIALEDQDGQATPAGFTQLYPRLSSVRATKNWLLNDLYVDAGFRKQGVGEALLKAAMDFARETGAAYVKLETAADNYIAQSLYEATGFIKQPGGGEYLTYQIDL